MFEHSLAAFERDDELAELDGELDEEKVELELELGALFSRSGYRVVDQSCPDPGTVGLCAEIEQSSWTSRARLRRESGEAKRSPGASLVSGL